MVKASLKRCSHHYDGQYLWMVIIILRFSFLNFITPLSYHHFSSHFLPCPISLTHLTAFFLQCLIFIFASLSFSYSPVVILRFILPRSHFPFFPSPPLPLLFSKTTHIYSPPLLSFPSPPSTRNALPFLSFTPPFSLYLSCSVVLNSILGVLLTSLIFPYIPYLMSSFNAVFRFLHFPLLHFLLPFYYYNHNLSAPLFPPLPIHIIFVVFLPLVSPLFSLIKSLC